MRETVNQYHDIIIAQNAFTSLVTALINDSNISVFAVENALYKTLTQLQPLISNEIISSVLEEHPHVHTEDGGVIYTDQNSEEVTNG